jgi:glycosyltransferase involved in cell wall biosynthesis
MSIYIILSADSQGLYNDANILRNILDGYDIIIKQFDSIQMILSGDSQDLYNFINSVDKSDILIFIENIPYLNKKIDKNIIKEYKTILIPNFERLTNWRTKMLKNYNINNGIYELLESFNYVFCKNYFIYYSLKHIYNVKNLKFNLEYTGFTSIIQDINKNVYDKNTIVHNRGTSPYKNSRDILKTWKLYPNLPELTFKYNGTFYSEEKDEYNECIKENAKINVISDKLMDNEYKNFLEKYEIFLCPSFNEGFGHYINEARGMGKLIISIDAPPMNELIIDNYNGFLVKPNRRCIQFISKGFIETNNSFHFDPKDLYEKIKYVMNISDKKRDRIKNYAIQSFIKLDIFTNRRIKDLVKNI